MSLPGLGGVEPNAENSPSATDPSAPSAEASQPGSNMSLDKMKENWKLWAGIGGGILALIILLTVLVCIRKRKAAKAKADEEAADYNKQQIDQMNYQNTMAVPTAGGRASIYGGPGGFVDPRQQTGLVVPAVQNRQSTYARSPVYPVTDVDSEYAPTPAQFQTSPSMMQARTPTQISRGFTQQTRTTLQVPGSHYSTVAQSPMRASYAPTSPLRNRSLLQPYPQ